MTERVFRNGYVRLPNGGYMSRSMWLEERRAVFPRPSDLSSKPAYLDRGYPGYVSPLLLNGWPQVAPFSYDDVDLDEPDIDAIATDVRTLRADFTNHVANGHPLTRAARDQAAGRLSPARPLERPQVKPQGFVARDTGVQRE